MALDKLVDSAQLDVDLTAVANAIRAKTGGNGSLIFPSGFIGAIENIPGEWTTAGFAAGTEPSGNIVIPSSSLVPLFYGFSAITRVVAPYLTQAKANQFRSMSALTTIIAQEMTTFASACIMNNAHLTVMDLKGGDTLGTNAFGSNTRLTTVIFRNTSTIQSASQSNMFDGSKSTAKPIHVFVPNALKATYEAAANWSTWGADGTVIFDALEGSAYEQTDWWMS